MTFDAKVPLRITVPAVLLVVILLAVPAGAVVESARVVMEEDLAEQQALDRLAELHRLPETLEYVPPAPWALDEIELGSTYTRDEPATNQYVMSTTAPFAATGTAKLATLAIEFTDVAHALSNSVSRIQDRVTGSNSMRTYYEEVSYDKLTVDGTASGWYTAANTMAYYGAPEGGSSDSRHFSELIREAVLAADSSVDFSQYDTNHDRIIDGVCLVHAGRDEATGGGQDAIWSKQSVYPGTLRVDGVYLGYYFTVSEYSPIGVYVHEFGHMLGLPDLYDTDYSSVGVGIWDVMGSGAWGGNGYTPSHFSAWSKTYMEWITPTTVSNYVEGREIIQAESLDAEILKLPTESSSEYFLLENRQRSGYDASLPGGGLLIWHIDTQVISNWLIYNRVNNNEARKGVDLEEASGTQELDDYRYYNQGDSNDPWRADVTGFTPDSTPSSRLYDGTDTKIRVFNISGSGSVMTVDIDFGGDSYAIFLDTMSSRIKAHPQEAVVYNITVGTRSSLGDLVHLTVTGTHASWAYLDPKWSTVDLGPKGSRVVQLRVTPPAGTPKDMEGEVILRARSDTVTSITAQLETVTTVKQLHRLVTSTLPGRVLVTPGTPKHVDITITNQGNGLENVTLALDANRSYWGSINPSKVSLAVLGSTNVRLTFSVPEGVMAGEEEPFTLTLFSEVLGGGFEGDEQVSLVPNLEAALEMVVAEIVSLRWGSVQDEHVMPGGTVVYELDVFNEGNSDVPVVLGWQAPEGWDLLVDDADNLTIPAFQAVTLKANLTAPDDVLANTLATVNLSAGVRGDFFYSTLKVRVDQRFALEVYGQSARFADPSERAVFALTVTNTGNGVDRVNVEIAGNGGAWTSDRSPNFVDLGTDEARRIAQVQVYLTPPSDAEAYEENTITVNFRSQNGEVTASFPVTLTVNPITSFSVETEVISDTVDPSDPTRQKATYLVHVINTGNMEDLFHVGLRDLPEGWTSQFESHMFSVPANKRRMVEFSILPPASDTTTRAGTFIFWVDIASELSSGAATDRTEQLEVTVVSLRGHTVETLEPSYTAPSGSRLTLRVLVVNEGNVPETLVLSAVGEFESYRFERTELSLEPFGQRVVNLTLELPTFDEDTTIDVQVIATTKDMTKQENIPVPVDVQAVEGLPGPGALAALVAVGLAAMAAATTGRRLRR